MSVKLRKLKLAKGRQQLYLDIHPGHGQQRTRQYLKIYLTPKSQDANKEAMKLGETIRAKKQIELAGAPFGLIAQHKGDNDFIAFFERVSKAKGRSWKSALKQLQAFTPSIRVSSINEDWLEALQIHLLERVKRSSADTYYAKVKAALAIALRERLIPYNPADRVKGVGRNRENPKMLILAEMQKLSETPCRNEEVKRAFLFACYTGLRYGDLKRVTWANIQGESLVLTQQKTKRSNTIPLHAEATALLGERASKDELLFDLPASHGNMWKILREWGEEAGIETKLSAHVARHTFATLLLTYDTSIYTVKTLMGHTSMNHTEVYAKIIDSVKQRAITALPTLHQ